MSYKNQDEINLIAKKFIELKNKTKRSKSKKLKLEFKNYQNFCVSKLKFLVLGKVYRYRTFSNYEDLIQDGFEALLAALKTYNYEKGNFTWWADKYISTRISRSANAHSTIRIPIKKAKELKPFKTNTFPLMIDSHNPFDELNGKQNSTNVEQALKKLPSDQQKIIKLIYGLYGKDEYSIDSITEMMSLSKSKCLKLLEEAKSKLREELVNNV